MALAHPVDSSACNISQLLRSQLQERGGGGEPRFQEFRNPNRSSHSCILCGLVLTRFYPRWLPMAQLPDCTEICLCRTRAPTLNLGGRNARDAELSLVKALSVDFLGSFPEFLLPFFNSRSLLLVCDEFLYWGLVSNKHLGLGL